jgi:tetratricopeptide (TPR) repeat protein
MTKQYPEYDIPKRSLKDRMFSQRPSALIIEALLVLVAVVVTIGFLSPATPVEDNSDTVIAELEATIAAQEAALAEAAEAVAQAADAAAIPRGFLSATAAKNMAWSSLTNEEYRSAIALYEALIAEGEAEIDTYFGRAYAYSMIDEHALAAQDYAVVLQERPDDLGALNNRCWAYSEIGEFGLALDDCNRLMSLVPDADYPYLNRGIVLEKMGEMDAALDDYVEWIQRKKRRVIRNDNLVWEGSLEVPMAEGHVYVFPFSASAGQEVVITAISSQRDVDADPLVLILDPDGKPLTANDDTGEWWDSYVHFRAPVSGEYAVVLTHAGGSTEGRVEVSFDIAGEFTLGNDIARFKSDAYRALMSGDYPTALENFRRVLSLNHQDAEAMNWIGVTYRYVGDFEASISHISMAMQLDESYTLPYLSRGITYENMGQAEASAADYVQYALMNRTRTLFHAELEGDSSFELPMREGWVYSIPFDAKSGQTIDISVATVQPGFVDPLIILIGPDGKALVGDDDISRSEYDSVISDYSLSRSGEYTLVVSHAEGGANGTIKVDVDVTESAPMSVQYMDGYGCGGGH